jgi:hypothetical protein
VTVRFVGYEADKKDVGSLSAAPTDGIIAAHCSRTEIRRFRLKGSLYQTAETLTHPRHGPRLSAAPISLWTTVPFCNGRPGGVGTRHESGSASFGITPRLHHSSWQRKSKNANRWLTVMCNPGSGTARWAGGLRHMKHAAGVCPPVRGTRYAAGGGGGGFGGLGGGGLR